jgi:hypothetical protein
MARVLLGWSDAGSVHGLFAQSLLGLQRFELTQPVPDYTLDDITRISSIYIQDNRNDLVDLLLARGDDWLLQLDTDESFPPTLLRQLMRTADPVTRPIVVGLYANVSTDAANGSMCIVDHIFGEREDGQYTPVVPPENLQPFQVDAAGTGVFLTHRSVFERIAPPWFWLEKIQLPNGKIQTMNEDIAFCRLAREAGFPIWCDPLAEVVHWKTLPLVASSMRGFLARVDAVKATVSAC